MVCRLGFIVDFLSHAAIVGFMGGAATVVCLQQLKSILGLVRFTHEADLVSVMRSVFGQTREVPIEHFTFFVLFCYILIPFCILYLNKKENRLSLSLSSSAMYSHTRLRLSYLCVCVCKLKYYCLIV